MKLNSYILLLSALLYGCACTSETQQQKDANIKLSEITIELQIPEEVIKKADEIIINRTGDKFFRKYITLNLEKSREMQDAYYLSYNFKVPEKPFINEEITLIVDKKGNPLPDFEIAGIPDCINDSCGFDVSKERALAIAEQAGMKKGIREWDTNFEWDSAQNKYVWLIRSTLSESEGSNGKRGTGERILIDPNSGVVLSKTEWKVF